MPNDDSGSAARRQCLTIRVSRASLSFSAADSRAEHQVRYEPYTLRSGVSIAANLREAFRDSSWPGTGWSRAMVMVDAPALIVPADRFGEEAAEMLYNHAFIGREGDAVLHTVLPALGAVVVFGVNKDLRLVVGDNVGEAVFTHLCVPVWNHLYRRSFTGPRRKLFGYFHDKKLEVFSFHQNRFRFCNTFDADNSRDSVYYLLYVWKQTGMNQRFDEIHIAGDIPEAEQLVDMLRRYVRNAYVINPTADFNRSPVTRIKGMPYDLMTFHVKGR